MVTAVAALAGSLDDFPAPHLIRLVARARRSGTLSVLSAGVTVVVCFDDGAVTYAGPADHDVARAALLSTGLVHPEQWDERGHLSGGGGSGVGVRRDRGPGAGPGAPGALEGFDEAVRDLAVSTVFELMLPSNASFRFEHVVDHRLAGVQHLDAEQLISEAEARLEAWRLIADVIPSTRVVVRLAGLLPPGTERVWIDRDEWPVLAAIDGRRDVAAIVDHTGLSAFGVCGVLHRLVTLGVAEPVFDG